MSKDNFEEQLEDMREYMEEDSYKELDFENDLYEDEEE